MTSRSVVWRALRIGALALAVLAAIGHASGRWPIRTITLLDLFIADTRLQLLMPRTIDPRIVIVDVDEASLATLGHWPWGRDRLAQLTDELFVNQRAAVVGFDMVFAERDASASLAALDRLVTREPQLGAAAAALRGALDVDPQFARALTNRNAVLGLYLTNEGGALRSGSLPRPAFDPEVLEGRAVDFREFNGYTASLDILTRAAASAGFFNHVPDADGVVRSVPLLAKVGDRHIESLSLAIYRCFTGDSALLPGFTHHGRGWYQSSGQLKSVLLVQGQSQHEIPVERNVSVRVPFRGPGGALGESFEYVSASKLLTGGVAPGHLAGKLVIVGTTAPGLFDQRPTPVSQAYPGVEVHANLLSGMLDRHLPVRPDWVEAFEVVQVLVVTGVLAALLHLLRAVRAMQFAGLFGASLIAFNLWAYQVHGLVLPLGSALLVGAVVYFGLINWNYIVEGRSRRSLARLFGNYVPRELVAKMALDPDRYSMKGENRDLTIMFCDMREFTRVSEGLPPDRLRLLINTFFSAMTEPIHHHRGTLDKYIGDAVMAFWGAPVADPNHAANAVRAALAMSERLASLNAELRALGFREIGFGIGLASGDVNVGDMGSQFRRSYTVMGDPVNQASRIEGVTKHYGLVILANGDTVTSVDAAEPGGHPLEWRWLEIDRVRVKGKALPVTLFTPIRTGSGDTATSDYESRIWRLALAAYRLQHWDESEAHLLSLQSAYPASSFTTLYRQLGWRIERHRHRPPPADWDGAHTFDTK